ncbi:MAG TPA: c-type cytochrome [Burkholderiales bacterium]|jgi:mono/diheme cytochrome c family protein|nr:c-type cytochrome [Burkholderiales bacterium]
MRATLLGVMLVAASATASAQEDFSFARRLYLDKAQCSYCHGWAGDGAGEGQSNGGAANLRQTKLNRAQLITTILCGRPGTAMPHFDEAAYTDKRCYNTTEKELGKNTPALPPGSTLQAREAEAIADYVLAKFAGRGAATRAECEETFGTGARACGEYAVKP